MKRLKTLFSLLLLALSLHVASCAKETDIAGNAEQTMVVSYTTLDGCWRLDAWNMESMSEQTYCYVDFDRTERRFEMWDNIASMYARKTTGTFSIEQDDHKRYSLGGTYDHGVGDWNMEYEVVMFYPGDRMTWRSTTSDDMFTYTRVESIPEL